MIFLYLALAGILLFIFVYNFQKIKYVNRGMILLFVGANLIALGASQRSIEPIKFTPALLKEYNAIATTDNTTNESLLKYAVEITDQQIKAYNAVNPRFLGDSASVACIVSGVCLILFGIGHLIAVTDGADKRHY